jgi:PEP-CTERM motif-containing protein
MPPRLLEERVGMFNLRTLVPVLAISILLVVPAEATTSYYTGASGETSFNTAVGGLTLLDPSLTFSSGDLGTNGLFNASGTGIDFLGFDGGFPGFGPLDFTVNTGKLTATNGGEVVQINLPATGIYAVGIHITTTTGLGNWCIDVTTNGCANNVVETAPATIFFGFVSPTPVTAPLYIHPLGGVPTIVLTNFEAYGAGSLDPVPEPRTMLLVGLGLVILSLVQKKTRPKILRSL